MTLQKAKLTLPLLLFIVSIFFGFGAHASAQVGNAQQQECAERGLVWNESERRCKEIEGKNNTAGPKAPERITNAERDRLTYCDGRSDPQGCLQNNPIITWTLFITNFLAVGVGVVVTIMIIVGGIQYASAGSNPAAIQSAKKKIANAILALIAYMFLFAFVQYLVPGGIF